MRSRGIPEVQKRREAPKEARALSNDEQMFVIGFHELDKMARLAKISAIDAAYLLLIREGSELGPPNSDVEAPRLAHMLLTADEIQQGRHLDDLIRTTHQPYAEWLLRARAAGVKYLSAHDLAVKKYGQSSKSKRRRPPTPFVTALELLLQEIENAAERAGKPFDRKAMPGIDKNLFDQAKKRQGFPIGKSVSTFQAYRKASGLCSFCTHATSTDFYEKLCLGRE